MFIDFIGVEEYFHLPWWGNITGITHTNFSTFVNWNLYNGKL